MAYFFQLITRKFNQLFVYIVPFMLFMVILSFSTFAQNSKTDIEIKRILKERVDLYKKSVGIIVGIVDKNSNKYFSYGQQDIQSNKGIDSNTVFEIGSISKIFTTSVLSLMVESGLVSLNDPIQKYLPKTVKVPTLNGKEIKFRDLATHTSGLPRMPINITPKDPENPYADYTVEKMYLFLSNYKLQRDIGSKYEYSNLGVGLLGHILFLIADKDYESLVIEKICKPLNMNSTAIKLSPDLENRLAKGHNGSLKAVKNWDFSTLAGAGAIRSTARDLLKFISANLGTVKSDLLNAFLKTHIVQDSTNAADLVIGLGWHIYKRFGSEIIWHNGSTGGYHSFIGFDKDKQIGAVVLSNSTNSIDDIGFHILNEKYELEKFPIPREHKVIKIDYNIYESYFGEYELVPNFILTVRKDSDKLFVKATGQQELEVFPEAENEFFYTVVDAQITFVKDEKGKINKLILHQNGRDMPAKKIK